MPALSLIVPTRNRARLFGSLLPSLAQQQASESYEVIVADNGSTDGTAALVRDASAHWPHVRLLAAPEPGAARARHAGALAAQGAIVLFIDDDMRAEPNVVAEHLRIHREVPGACVLGQVLSASSRHPFERMMAYVYDGPRTTLARRTPTFEDVWPGHLSLTKEAYLRLGGFTPRFAELGSYAGGEGIDFGLRVVESGLPVRFAAGAVTHHHFTARFGSALRRCYVNGLAFGRLMHERDGLAISGVERTRSPLRARALESVCRLAAWTLEPFARGEGPPPAPLALVYSLGMKAATGRGVWDAERDLRRSARAPAVRS